MNGKDYLSELLSIQCEHAYGTMQRLKDTGTLSDEDRSFLVQAQDVLIRLRDRFRVVGPGDTGPGPDGEGGDR